MAASAARRAKAASASQQRQWAIILLRVKLKVIMAKLKMMIIKSVQMPIAGSREANRPSSTRLAGENLITLNKKPI